MPDRPGAWQELQLHINPPRHRHRVSGGQRLPARDLVGVDASDSVVETIKGQRLAATIVGLLFGAVLVLGISQVTLVVTGLDTANADGNVQGLAKLLFSNYVFAFEATSALLITAAVGAMVLAHRERLTPKETQAERAAQRMRAYVEDGAHLGPLPSPGGTPMGSIPATCVFKGGLSLWKRVSL